MFCEKCGGANPPYGVFCQHCGHSLRNTTQENSNNTHNINLNIGRPYNPYKTNNYAIWSLILACCSFIFGWLVVAAVAVVLGNIAKKQISASNEQGEGLASAGIIIGWINIGVSVFALVIILIFFAGISSYLL